MHIKRFFALSAATVFIVVANAQQKSAEFGVSCTVLAPPHTENWSGVAMNTAMAKKANTNTPRMRFISVGGSLPPIAFKAEKVVGGEREKESFTATLPDTIKLEAKPGPQPSYIRITFQTDASPGTEPVIEEVE